MQQSMEELEQCAAHMAWDWEADEIDPNEDEGKIWIPMMPQTLVSSITKWVARVNQTDTPATLPR